MTEDEIEKRKLAEQFTIEGWRSITKSGNANMEAALDLLDKALQLDANHEYTWYWKGTALPLKARAHVFKLNVSYYQRIEMSDSKMQSLIGIGSFLIVFGLIGYLYPGGFLEGLELYIAAIGAIFLVVGLLFAFWTTHKQQEQKT